MRCLRVFLAVPFILGLAFGKAEYARAADFAVNPVSVTLPRGNSSTFVTIINQGKDKVRFQVTGFVWGQDPGGKMQLAPTDEFIAFPSIFALEGGESRRVRIGTTAAAGDIEKSFRMFVTELPPLESVIAPQRGLNVAVRTKIGIPIFISPATETVKPELAPPAIRHGVLHIDVINAGSVHFSVKRLRVSGRSAAGAPLDESTDGWYVLPGGHRDFQLNLTRPACAGLAPLSVEITTDRATISKQFDHVAGDCAN